MNAKQVFLSSLVSLGIVFTAISGYVFNRYVEQYPLPEVQQFDRDIHLKYQVLINDEKPQILFLGDSIIDSNIDAQLVAEKMNKRVSLITEHGSGSSLFYLILKNNIVTAHHRPEMLIIVSRGSILTAPGFRVHGGFFARLDDFASQEDDLVLQLGIRNQMSWIEKYAERFFPPYWARWKLRAALDSRIRYIPTRIILGCDRICSDTAMERVFGGQNFNPAYLNDAINWTESYFYTEENLDFDNQVGQSFLPEIIRLCNENNIRLVLVQTKTMQFSRERPEPESLTKYTNALADYAARHHVLFIDFSHDPRLGQELFYDSNHLSDEGKQVFTDMLIEELSEP